MRALVIIPAFNEAANLGKVLARIRLAHPELPAVVIDDGSSDETSAVARQAGAHVLRLPFNMGYGVALQTGYKYAVREGCDYVVQLDGDGQHEPADVSVLLDAIRREDTDVALGSRFLGEDTYQPVIARRLGMRLFCFLANLLTETKFSDVTSGFQALNADVLRFFTTERYPVDYPDADVLIMLSRAGFKIKEVPVRMYPRTGGGSMHSGFRPLYYIFKMLLSVLLTPLRRETPKRKGA